ncbi:MAG: hypothetical protein HS103_06250 [Anaerolineales bacterium]|nr:hypothetical protein [Anaerolineales bacterium]
MFTSPTQLGAIYDIAWDSTETKIISGTEEIDGGELRVIPLDAAILSERIGGPGLALETSPSGLQIAVGTVGGRVILRDTTSFEYINIPPITNENLQPIFALSWHPSQTLIASGHLDGMIRILDINSDRILQVLSSANVIGMNADYSQLILALAFDSTGTRLRSFNREGRIRVWDTQTWALIAEQIVPGPIYAADWDKTGTTLYYGTDSSDTTSCSRPRFAVPSPHPHRPPASDLPSPRRRRPRLPRRWRRMDVGRWGVDLRLRGELGVGRTVGISTIRTLHLPAKPADTSL